MRLILSGGGKEDQTKKIDSKFAKLLTKSKPLVYIPIAIDTKKHPYPECLNWLKKIFDPLGIKKYEMWTEEDLQKKEKINPEDFAGIYIGGGNTPYLLKTLKKFETWEFLKEAVKKDVPIYGGSAGAIIFTKSIIPSLSADKNYVHLRNFDGMNLAKDKEIWCHYNGDDKIIKEFIKKYDLGDIVALPEGTGLFITKDIQIIGEKPAYLFQNNLKKEIKPGQNLK